MPENAPLYDGMRVREFLAFMARIKGLARSAVPVAVDAACARLALERVADLQIGTLQHIFFQMAALLLLLVPVVTMRLLAEERKTGTLELLLTSPVLEIEVVLAKFAASMAVVVVMLGLSLAYATVLALYGTPDWGPIYTGYLGLLLFAGALVALGLTVSSLTANQVVAAVVSLGIFFLLWMIDSLGYLLPDPFDTLSVNLSLLAHVSPFVLGSVFLSDVGFFVSVILLGLLFSVRALARR